MRETINNYFISLVSLLSNKKSYELFIALLILIFVILISDYFFRFVIAKLLKKANQNSNLEWYVILYKKSIFTSIAHFFSFGLGFSISHILLENFKPLIKEVDKLFFIAICLFFFQLVFRLIDVVGIITNKEEETYRRVAYRTFSQFFKIVVILIGLIVIISLLFNVNLNTIVTSISAITAIILLIFKDTIVGFISGIQISTTKILKIGDIISIEKFNIEGIVKEINLTSTKIENFDKSISFIPTFDLLNSKIINHQPVIDLNLKKIKRTIFFNANSVSYLTQDKLELLVNYFSKTIFANQLKDLDSKTVSNIELFNLYLGFYLKNHTNIFNNEPSLVSVLPINNNSIPIQISGFCNSSNVVVYEQLISEILMHGIITSREFGLELTNNEH